MELDHHLLNISVMCTRELLNLFGVKLSWRAWERFDSLKKQTIYPRPYSFLTPKNTHIERLYTPFAIMCVHTHTRLLFDLCERPLLHAPWIFWFYCVAHPLIYPSGTWSAFKGVLCLFVPNITDVYVGKRTNGELVAQKPVRLDVEYQNII